MVKPKTKKPVDLDRLAEEVAQDQAAIDGQTEDTRERVIRMGKKLREMQAEQKTKQEETGQTWKDWCEEQKSSRTTFPVWQNCAKYMLVAKYPEAYERGMSIKEAYKQAGKWKKNGGNPPIKEKVTISTRSLATITIGAGRLAHKIDELTENKWDAKQEQEQWTTDELTGTRDQITLLVQSCRHLLQKLNQVKSAV